jgi:Fur family zinc uptake transcriptional regulator
MNSDIVLDIIKKSKKNLTAYEILEKFEKIKKVKPMTIYRALNSLIADGLIHKSNQNKTFVLCNHDHGLKHNPALAICKKCGDTNEIRSDIFSNLFKKYKTKNFDFTNFEIEVSALCRSCVN